MSPLLNIEPRQVLLGVGPKEKVSIMHHHLSHSK